MGQGFHKVNDKDLIFMAKAESEIKVINLSYRDRDGIR